MVSVSVVGEACFKIDCDFRAPFRPFAFVCCSLLASYLSRNSYSPGDDDERLGAFARLVVDAFARSSETRLGGSFAWICVAL